MQFNAKWNFLNSCITIKEVVGTLVYRTKTLCFLSAALKVDEGSWGWGRRETEPDAHHHRWGWITYVWMNIIQLDECQTHGSECDGTQNLKWNRYRYFFWYQTFPIPIPVLFSVPNFSDSIPRLFLIPIFSDTHTNTTKNLRNSRYRYLFGTVTIRYRYPS